MRAVDVASQNYVKRVHATTEIGLIDTSPDGKMARPNYSTCTTVLLLSSFVLKKIQLEKDVPETNHEVGFETSWRLNVNTAVATTLGSPMLVVDWNKCTSQA